MWKFYYGTATPSLRNGLFILIMMVCLWLAYVAQKKQSERTPIKFMFMLMFVGFYLLVSRDICFVYSSHPHASRTSAPQPTPRHPHHWRKIILRNFGFFLCYRIVKYPSYVWEWNIVIETWKCGECADKSIWYLRM